MTTAIRASAQRRVVDARMARERWPRRLLALWALVAASFGGLASAADAPAAPGAFRLPAWPAHVGSPDFRLVDVDGHRRTLASYRGRVVLVYFGFVGCPGPCPDTLFKLALVMKRLGPVRERVNVLFVTLDPERDTPDALRKYLGGFDRRFVALTGSGAEVDRAAERFFIQYARVAQAASYTIEHPSQTFVFDAAGRLRLVAGAEATVEDLAHDLAVLAAP